MSFDQQTETVRISSLLASRLCHDLVNPVGALMTGLDFLKNNDEPEMQADALALVTESTQKTVDILTFARLAFGSSGGWEGDLDLKEAKEAAQAYYRYVHADLDWQIEDGMAPKATVRCLLNTLMMVEVSVPRRGSSVTVAQDGAGYLITAKGPKAKLPDTLTAPLTGNGAEVEAKATPAYLAALLGDLAGLAITPTLVAEDEVQFALTPVQVEMRRQG